jgi:hypothetical protein
VAPEGLELGNGPTRFSSLVAASGLILIGDRRLSAVLSATARRTAGPGHRPAGAGARAAAPRRTAHPKGGKVGTLGRARGGSVVG